MLKLSTVFCICLCLVSVRAAPEKNLAGSRKLSDKEHFDKDGKHNKEYDHEAFLGKEKKSFDKLTPEESIERLGKLVDQIDKDGDGKVSAQELKDWIQFSKTQQHLDAAGKRWEDTKTREEKLVSRSDFKGDKSIDPMGPLPWERYKRMSYGPDPENHEDSKRLLKQMKMDERRWKAADLDHDGKLSKAEFAAFNQPWEYDYMHVVAAQENLEDMDKDKDGKISLQEFLEGIYQKSASEMTEEELKRKEADKEYFQSERDRNKDGFLDTDEMKEWLFPTSFDYLAAEASHLIYHADSNEV
ncbi:PREDICTED: calumenin-like isoform X3 [Acropora digitifera]|uniref:calumenin-like isoform X3 n=1 Tax=Acropora digitifera TaxID=70779 RepID=UPI00077A4C37|nr:PREDICTED: calumenin-like isoform X3 [Acropora digitifera]